MEYAIVKLLDDTVVSVSISEVVIILPHGSELEQLFITNRLHISNYGPLDALSTWWSGQRSWIVPVLAEVHIAEE